MIRMRFEAYVVEEMLATGKEIKKCKIEDGLPPGYRLARAFVECRVLTLDFEPESNIVEDKYLTIAEP